MELSGRRAVVLGLGISGRAAARFLLDRGAAVDIHDIAPRSALHPDVSSLERAGARVLSNSEPLSPDAYQLAVVSPGIPSDAPALAALRASPVEVIGELELASRFLTAPILAVTGTNGKTTVTEMLGEILRRSGHRVFVGGNVGTPLVEAAGEDWDAVVVEVSSFQLETIQTFHPRVGVLLNVTDDHLERYANRGAYARAKARLFENQGAGDVAVVNGDDPLTAELGSETDGVLLLYSTNRPLSVGAWLEGEDAVFLLPGADCVRVPAQPFDMLGRHNLGNGLAACLAAAAFGVEPAAAWSCVREFRGLPHRMEIFLEWEGIRFVDDSKATNVDAACKALDTVPPPVIWLAGGVDKGGDYAPLLPRLRARVRETVLAGPASGRMRESLAGAAPIRVAPDWPTAIREAAGLARSGDTVLLAPACSSFDAFRNYAERGDTFQRICREEIERRARVH